MGTTATFRRRRSGATGTEALVDSPGASTEPLENAEISRAYQYVTPLSLSFCTRAPTRRDRCNRFDDRASLVAPPLLRREHGGRRAVADLPGPPIVNAKRTGCAVQLHIPAEARSD